MIDMGTCEVMDQVFVMEIEAATLTAAGSNTANCFAFGAHSSTSDKLFVQNSQFRPLLQRTIGKTRFKALRISVNRRPQISRIQHVFCITLEDQSNLQLTCSVVDSA